MRWPLGRRPVVSVCALYIGALVVIGIIAPLLLPGVDRQHAGDLLAVDRGPSGAHLLGTDSLGRDVLERLLVGTRITMLGVLEAVTVGVSLGLPVGVWAGFKGGRVDALVNWLADLTFSVPAIIVIIIVLSVVPESMLAGMATLGLLAAPGIMRVVRSVTSPIRRSVYVDAATVAGLSGGYIVRHHVMPRIAGPVIVQIAFLASIALLVQSGLAFLNLLVAAPAPSWGGMIADGTSVLLVDPWLIWPAGVAIAATVVAFVLLGDAARDGVIERWAPAAVPPPRRRRLRTQEGRKRQTHKLDDAGDEGSAVLRVKDLGVELMTSDGSQLIIDDVSFDLRRGEAVGLVGESGCGKSMTAAAILGILPARCHVASGQVLVEGKDVVRMPGRGWRGVRGKAVAYVSQEPTRSLNPAFRISWQLSEAIRCHTRVSRKEAGRRAMTLLEQVHLPDPVTVGRRYPHELSGGMAQRVAIARALAGDPKILIADEPTTALDVTVQASILDLFRELTADIGMALLLITHDWGVVADICERAVVMYAGQVVERASVDELFTEPRHPYTRALLGANPHGGTPGTALPIIGGGVPPPGARPSGCRFAPRCRFARPMCRNQEIALEPSGSEREVRCVLAIERN